MRDCRSKEVQVHATRARISADAMLMGHWDGELRGRLDDARSHRPTAPLASVETAGNAAAASRLWLGQESCLLLPEDRSPPDELRAQADPAGAQADSARARTKSGRAPPGFICSRADFMRAWILAWPSASRIRLPATGYRLRATGICLRASDFRRTPGEVGLRVGHAHRATAHFRARTLASEDRQLAGAALLGRSAPLLR